jgi:methionyl-tRNA formyltransferase
MVAAPSLRIVYFGTPEFAVPSLRALLESSHSVAAVVSQPDRPKGRGHKTVPTPTRQVAAASGIPVLQPSRIRDEAFLGAIRDLVPDLGVVAAYGKILPDALLRIPRLGMINVHASLLPRWRGAAPVHRAVIAGDRETGVTIMRVVQELDAGPTFLMRPRPIGPDETSIDVERELAHAGAALLVEVVDLLAQGRASETAQDDAKATYAPKITRDEGTIAWTLPAEQIHNLVRGLQPWPLVSGRIRGERVLIHRTQLTGTRIELPGGSLVRVDAGTLELVGGDGGRLRLLQIQPEGSRVMSARDFLAGRRFDGASRIERA